MIVLDTHALLWWQVVPRELSQAARRALERADRIGICTVSVFELAGLTERRRIRIETPIRTWVANALGRDGVEALVLTPEIALDAAQLRFTPDPFDRIIYVTARAEDAELVTRDERMSRFDVARTVW